MAQDERVIVNPNSADIKTLMTVPGVGESMAQRILDARPFTDHRDMQRVSGLGSATLKRMKPYLTFKTESDGILHKPAEKAAVDEALPHSESRKDGAKPKTAVRPKRSSSPQETITAQIVSILQDRFGLVIVAAGISVLLSVILTLSILAGINGTINVGNHASVLQVGNELATLQVEVDDILSRIDAINLRLEAIEGLSGRVQIVEDQFATLREDVSGSLDDVAEIQTQIVEINTNLDSITQSVDLFTQFLEGLRELIMDALPLLETTTP
jgi:methyl-accepting chemotaxis protein